MKCPRCHYITPTRNLDQNALAEVWYRQVADTLKQDTPLGVKCYAKLHFGIPILRTESEEFRAKYDRLIKHLPYEDKLQLMEWLPVTSLMTIGQMSRYMGDIQHHYGALGVALVSLNEGVA